MELQSLVDHNWNVDLVHAFREANQAANHMAKLSHTLSEDLYIFYYP
ncbi:uncharacterized protein G2W53_013483 [Senna tora]|uniref:Uncharacterized protein n=1 Tax=Senna tora TaxID=362788 RepID=A0A834TYY6_9FABA|nr:uncharacterized protein G2W53_013483 [Senna tora]